MSDLGQKRTTNSFHRSIKNGDAMMPGFLVDLIDTRSSSLGAVVRFPGPAQRSLRVANLAKNHPGAGLRAALPSHHSAFTVRITKAIFRATAVYLMPIFAC